MIAREHIALAVDSGDPAEIRHQVDLLAGEVGVIKLGAIPFTACGPALVREVAGRVPVFLDLKYHDIPNTVAGAVGVAARLGVRLITVHASGGPAMIAAAVAAARKGDDPPKIIAVTVLTSLAEADLAPLGVGRPIGEQVLALGRMAIEAGADGLVSSPHEVAALRAALGPRPYLVVPGIRPPWSEAQDQRRTDTPSEALTRGADLLVIGRPILAAPDPVAAARRLRAEG